MSEIKVSCNYFPVTEKGDPCLSLEELHVCGVRTSKDKLHCDS